MRAEAGAEALGLGHLVAGDQVAAGGPGEAGGGTDHQVAGMARAARLAAARAVAVVKAHGLATNRVAHGAAQTASLQFLI